MRVFGIEINIGGSTTLDEIEQADQEYNALRDSGASDEADELAREMCNKGFVPYYGYCCLIQKVGSDLCRMSQFYPQVGIYHHIDARKWHDAMNYP